MLKYLRIRFVRDWVLFVERMTDRYTASRLSGGPVVPLRGLAMLALIVTGVVLIVGPIQSALRKSQTEPEYIGQYRAKMPEGLKIENGRLTLVCSGRENIRQIVKNYYNYSAIFLSAKMEEETLRLNPDGFVSGRCRKDAKISIPLPILEPVVNEPLGWPSDHPVLAVYLTGDNTVPRRLAAETVRLKSVGANAVVFDVKDILGVVNYRSSVPAVEEYRRYQPPIPSITKTIGFLHSNGIYVIARMALFQDQNLATRRPDLAIRDGNSPTGQLLVKGRPLWVDPGLAEVRQYNLDIVEELILLGVDEIQFDYVRYPAEGNLNRVTYHNVRDSLDKSRNLQSFLASAWMMTRRMGVRTAIDIFGVVAWGEEVDVKTTGQRIEMLAPFVDVISPMLYPSHFNAGFDGFDRPADQGFHFYSSGVRKVIEKASPAIVTVRPWVQAFKWRVSHYNENYIRDQINGIREGGGTGWMMWNAGNEYDLVYRALRNVASAPVNSSAPGRSAISNHPHTAAGNLNPQRSNSRTVNPRSANRPAGITPAGNLPAPANIASTPAQSGEGENSLPEQRNPPPEAGNSQAETDSQPSDSSER